MKKSIIIIALFVSNLIFAQTLKLTSVVNVAAKAFGSESSSFPKPAGINNMLFYVQRTLNSNTVIYELNLDKDGNINESEPIKIYWIKYSQNNKVDELNYIQRNRAYGLQTKMIDKEKKSFKFSFVSYKSKDFYLIKSKEDNKYHVYGYVNNKLCILQNIFVKVEGSSLGIPNVKQVEVTAKDPSDSSMLTEIVHP